MTSIMAKRQVRRQGGKEARRQASKDARMQVYTKICYRSQQEGENARSQGGKEARRKGCNENNCLEAMMRQVWRQGSKQ